jgi:hypothetical protein
VIPNVAHFIWFGAQLPWVFTLALRSAAIRGGFERVVLHHADDLAATPVWPELTAIPGFEARRLDATALARLFARLGPLGTDLARIYAPLRAPAARANVLRAAMLAVEGGVYLDLDTITVRSLAPLRAAHGAFCGEERLVWPAATRRDPSLLIQAAGLVRAGARDLCRRLPGGWQLFRAIEPLYPSAANNAVLAAEPGHPFVDRLIRAMATVPESRRALRFALGTHLLQDVLARAREPDLAVLPARVFYPLGPEISAQWFRVTRSPPDLDHLLASDTRVVHWYASVRTAKIVPVIDARYVREHAHRQAFAALAAPLLG